MSSLKLAVEVVSAHDLMPRDPQGSANAFVELHFDNQKFRTTTKEKDLNPVWNEQFYFNISDPASLPELDLEAYVYHINRANNNTKSFLGKARLSGTSFVNHSDAVALFYPLEKRGIFSRVKGELGLKVFLTDDPAVRSSEPVPVIDPFPATIATTTTSASSILSHQAQTQAAAILENRSEQPRYSFYHLPSEQHQYSSVAPQGEPPVRFTVDEMRPEPPRVVRMFSSLSSQQPFDFQPKETSPSLGGGRVIGGRVIPGEKAGAYDLVEKMQYLFVRVVKARELPSMDITGSLDPYVEVRLGNYKGVTKHFEKNQRPEWNEVYAFSRERVQASVIEVVVRDKDRMTKDEFVGRVIFEINEVPTRVPPDSPLAPEWYKLVDKKGEWIKGELMLAIWNGTQADECFPYATHADDIPTDSSIQTHIRGKVYHAPTLWYVRVNIIEVQDIVPSDKNRFAEVLVMARVGNQTLKTKHCQSRTPSYQFNEDLLFVAAEPFEEELQLSVVDHVGPDKDEVLGHVRIPLGEIARRLDNRPVRPSWRDLKRPGLINVDQLKEEKFASKINLRLCLEGGYHVLDESIHYSSDLRPTSRQLWKQPIGLLELGILNADGLHPVKTKDGRGTCDTYCVAKYGRKWVRTRTIIGNLSPRFNEQYTWDVHDHGTVLTIGVFDNCHLSEKSSSSSSNGQRDTFIGKVRIRLSTLQTERVYTHSYPLLVLQNSGVKKMGELHLALRFSATSFVDTLYSYSRPLLPKMHYIHPLSIIQQDQLRHQATQIVAQRLSRMEPPLRKEVVEYMSDAHAHLWSMRRSKANFFRLMSVFSGLLAVGKWFNDVCTWKNTITTILVHFLYLMLVVYPDLILPTICLYLFLIGLWNYRFRPRYPPHMNTRISHADAAHPDELDEEFDTFPTTRSAEIVRRRYDRLRSIAGRIQAVVGDIATHGERLQCLISWRDPRATALFLLFCLCAAVVFYVTPFSVVAIILGFYWMRHPRFRHKTPSLAMNFFRRLPARTDSLL
ncbi:FT-interacting protein 3-like [Typha angustifolia]|uniref:FT-interacting protein 3-like n=1 Tax=Typha angustifolia TaxID=59011 RepID=UPI003C2C6BFF